MKKQRELVYIPQDEVNLSSKYYPKKNKLHLTGFPCPRKEVVEKIGIDGVEAIDKKIKEMIKWRVLMFGRDSNKIEFPSRIEFFDKNDPVLCITCSPLINHREFGEAFEKNKENYYYPDKADSRLGGYDLEICDYVDSLQDKISKILTGLM